MKDILITGAYGGMGRAAVEEFRARGFRVFALDRQVDAPRENVIPIQADVTSVEGLSLAQERLKAYGASLDAIVHFAGIYMLDSLAEMSEEAFRRIFDVNLNGVFLVNKTFLPLMKPNGKILITTSELATLDPLPFTGIYAVSKAALDKYAYSLRMELQLLNITVSALRAGAVDTGMLGVSTDALDRFCKNTTLYSCNAKRFKGIVERVEARCISPQKLARKAASILEKNRPRFAYAINRNPLLLLLNVLPKRLQLFAIRLILR